MIKRIVIAGVIIGCLASFYTCSDYAAKICLSMINAPIKESRIVKAGYHKATWSDEAAIYQNTQGHKLLVTYATDSDAIIDVSSDTLLSSNSNMSVYGGIKLNDDEDKVIKYYGDPTFDIGRGKLYRKDYNGFTIYVGTLDGKVIHAEILDGR